MTDRVWAPHPKQRQALRRTEDVLFYGGARGGGKTDYLLGYQIGRRYKYAGTRGVIIRRHLVDFYQPGGGLDRSHELLGRDRSWAWNGQTRRWTSANGSYFSFEHCQREEDYRKFQGGQNEDVCFEEAGHFTEKQFWGILAARRTTRSDIQARARLTGNPGGVGHGWLKTMFVAHHPGGFETFTLPGTEKTSLPLSACYVPSKVHDNPSIVENDPAYIAYLESLPDGMRQAWLDGSWDVFEGQVFTEFRRDLHVVDRLPEDGIPADWRRIVAVDYGYASKLAVLWMAQNPNPANPEVFVYRELYVTGLRDAEQAEEIKRLSRGDGKISMVLGGHDMWTKKADSGLAAEEVYRAHGVEITMASNARVPGKMRVHDFLAPNPRTGRPFLRIYGPACSNLCRTIPDLVYDTTYVEDVDTEGEDHAYDALRYGLMALARPPRPVSPLKFAVEGPPRTGPFDPRYPSRLVTDGPHEAR